MITKYSEYYRKHAELAYNYNVLREPYGMVRVHNTVNWSTICAIDENVFGDTTFFSDEEYVLGMCFIAAILEDQGF